MDATATVVLRRVGAVALPASTEPPADGTLWVTALEADLAARGWLLEPPLRQAFASLDETTRARWADWVLAVADEMVGADREHVPLFRSFPHTPANPEKLFVERLLVHLFQAEDAPCVLCGAVDTVHPLDPCGHVVCVACFDPAAFSACPVCGRRLGAASPFSCPSPSPSGTSARAARRSSRCGCAGSSSTGSRRRPRRDCEMTSSRGRALSARLTPPTCARLSRPPCPADSTGCPPPCLRGRPSHWSSRGRCTPSRSPTPTPAWSPTPRPAGRRSRTSRAPCGPTRAVIPA